MNYLPRANKEISAIVNGGTIDRTFYTAITYAARGWE